MTRHGTYRPAVAYVGKFSVSDYLVVVQMSGYYAVLVIAAGLSPLVGERVFSSRSVYSTNLHPVPGNAVDNGSALYIEIGFSHTRLHHSPIDHHGVRLRAFGNIDGGDGTSH